MVYASVSGNVCSDSFGLFLMCAGNSSVVPADYGSLETLFKGAVKEKQPFERLVVSKEKLLEMFAVRLFKLANMSLFIPKDALIRPFPFNCSPVQQI